MMFVRFTIGRQDQRSGATEGLFTVAYRELGSGSLAAYEQAWLDELLTWFKRKVMIPGTVLRERGYHIQMHQTETPGILVYEDGHQVVAKTTAKNPMLFQAGPPRGPI